MIQLLPELNGASRTTVLERPSVKYAFRIIIEPASASSSAMAEEERLQRIGEILAKACRLYWARVEAGEIPAPVGYEFPKTAVPRASEPTDEERIISYLRRGPASPRELSVMLGFSRSTLIRRISKLIADGMVTRKGRTKQTEYRVK